MSKKHAFALELKISPKGRRPSIFISKTLPKLSHIVQKVPIQRLLIGGSDTEGGSVGSSKILRMGLYLRSFSIN